MSVRYDGAEVQNLTTSQMEKATSGRESEWRAAFWIKKKKKYEKWESLTKEEMKARACQGWGLVTLIWTVRFVINKRDVSQCEHWTV